MQQSLFQIKQLKTVALVAYKNSVQTDDNCMGSNNEQAPKNIIIVVIITWSSEKPSQSKT